MRHACQVGENRTYFRVGFAHVYGGPETLERNARLAQQNNLSLGVIFALQTHSVNKAIADLAATDLRNYQWRLNGTSWAGKEVSHRAGALPCNSAFNLVTSASCAGPDLISGDFQFRVLCLLFRSFSVSRTFNLVYVVPQPTTGLGAADHSYTL